MNKNNTRGLPMRTKLNWKLTKDEARKILAHCRANKNWSVEECLEGLNSGKYSEILLNTYAKIVGKDRNYSIMTYAEDANDGYYPMTVIGRLSPYETCFEQKPKHLVAHNRYDYGLDTYIFNFENGYGVTVSRNIDNIVILTLKQKSKQTGQMRTVKHPVWGKSVKATIASEVSSELNTIKNF